MTPGDIATLARDLGTRTRAFVVEHVEKALTGVRERLDALERTVDKDAVRLEGYSSFLQRDLAAVIERVAVVETRQSIPGPAGPAGKDGLNGKDGVDGAPGLVGEKGPVGPVGPHGPAGERGERGLDGDRGVDGIAGPEGHHGPVGEPGPKGERGDKGQPGERGESGLIGKQGPEGSAGRDGRDGQPGVPGAPGEKGLDGINGRDGVDGKNGLDGMGFDDIQVEHDGERGFSLKFMRGDRVKTFGAFRLPVMIHRGIWESGRGYEHMDVVQWGGSQWLAIKDAPAGKPEEANSGWLLVVKKGSAGKEGLQGPQGPQGQRGEKGERGPERW